MKTSRLISLFLLASVALLARAPGAWGAATNIAVAANATTNNAAAATNAGPVELPIPLAVFDLNVKQTKDPFFPLSTRQPIIATNNAAPAFSAGEFTLKGLSGSAGNRLALINNRTLADGENAEVTTPSGKIKIRCVEIRESSVLIRVGAQRETIEIFLRKAAQ